jgi:hypothetical protein
MLLFYALNIFGANVDWPSNNCEMWRYFPHCADGSVCETTSCTNARCDRNDPNLDPQLRDGRWRFKVHDMEFGYGLWTQGNPVQSATASTANTLHALINRTGAGVGVPGAGRGEHFNATQSASFMIPALLQREDMRARLANTFMDILSASHNPDYANAIYRGLRAQINAEHGHLLTNGYVSHLARNGTNAAHEGSWPNSLADLNGDDSENADTFVSRRAATIATMISAPHPSTAATAPTSGHGLGLSGSGTATRLTIAGTRDTAGGSATLNTRPIGIRSGLVTPHDPSINARDPRDTLTASVNYYGSGAIIPVFAHPWPGYVLDNFSVGGTRVPDAQVIRRYGRESIMVEPGAQVTITFRKADDATVHISQVQARSQNWFEVTNGTDRVLSTRGLYLSDNYEGNEESELRRPHDHRFRMPALIIQPGETVFFALSSNNTDDHLKGARTNFSLSFGERFRMADSQGNILQHIEVAYMERAQIQTRAPDGFWTIYDGPCRDCGRCGCTQCFAPSGRCEQDECERCNPLIPPGPAVIGVTGDVQSPVLTQGSQDGSIRAEITDMSQPWTITISIPGATAFLHGSPWGVPPFVTVSPLANGMFTLTGRPFTDWGSSHTLNMNWALSIPEG